MPQNVVSKPKIKPKMVLTLEDVKKFKKLTPKYICTAKTKPGQYVLGYSGTECRFYYIPPSLRTMQFLDINNKPHTFVVNWPHSVVSLRVYNSLYLSSGISALRSKPSKPYMDVELYRLPFPNISTSFHSICGEFNDDFTHSKATKDRDKDYIESIFCSHWIIEGGVSLESIKSIQEMSKEDPNWYNNKHPFSNFKPSFTIGRFGDIKDA